MSADAAPPPVDTETLKLAEKYYDVASHLQEQGQYFLRMASTLSSIADAMCENRPAAFIPENAG